MQLNSQPGSSYFLLSEAKLSGSPPHRAPPPVFARPTPNYSSGLSTQLDPSIVEEIAISGDEDGVGCPTSTVTPPEIRKDANVLSLGLPILCTGKCLSFIFLYIAVACMTIGFHLLDTANFN